MFNSIACQIQRLDKDIDGCKVRLNALKANHTRNAFKCTRHKEAPLRRSRSAMNRKKNCTDREHETCVRHSKNQKHGHEKPRKNKVVSESPCNKKNRVVKLRSRSASCGRDCDCLIENQFQNNDLYLKQDHPKQAKPKNSWANILTEHNRHNVKKVTSNSESKDNSDYNKYVYPTSIYLKNRGVQCTEPSFVPSKSNFSTDSRFTPYNPTRTLQFLMSEIRENLKHKREDKLLNIVSDMEDAIYRIKSNHEFQNYDSKMNTNQYIKQPMNNNLYYNQDMNKIFEDGFAKLETTCKSLELTCARLKEENKQLQLELEKRDATIASLEKKDSDNLSKIDLLNKHIFTINQKEEQFKLSVLDLTKLINKLQQDTKCIEPLKEVNSQMNAKISAINVEKDNAIYQNQLLKLEKEKLKVLLDMKEKQLSNFKDVFLGLEGRVKKEVKVMQGKCVSEDSDPDSSVPLCSSPNTSGSVLAPVYGSWRGVSRVSSNGNSACPSPPPITEQRIPSEPLTDLVNKLSNFDPNSEYPMRGSAQPLDMPVNLHVPPTKIEGLEDIRGHIKKIFIDPSKQHKPLEGHIAQSKWTNLTSVHSSATSFNSMG